MAQSSSPDGPDREDREREVSEEPIIRDNRKVDPKTGKVRKPAKKAAAPEPVDAEIASEDESGEAGDTDLGNLLSDADLEFLSGQMSAEDLAAGQEAELKRVQAEFFNYRKAREANHELERDRTAAEIAKELLPVLDDLDRAQKHGDLVEGSTLAVIAAKIRATTERLGLVPFGEAGEVFDPNLHEALFHHSSADVEVDTIADVIQTGYQLGSAMVRAARVVVTGPADGNPADPDTETAG